MFAAKNSFFFLFDCEKLSGEFINDSQKLIFKSVILVELSKTNLFLDIFDLKKKK